MNRGLLVRIHVKIGYTIQVASAWRMALWALVLQAIAACGVGNAFNPTATPAHVTSNISVIASMSSGDALERRALDANGGFAVDQWPYSQAMGQQWRVVPQADGSSLLMNVASGKALLATGVGNDTLQEADVSNDAALRWKLTYTSGSHIAVITHVATSACLQASSGDASVGAPVHVAVCDNSAAQTWVVQALSDAAVSKTAFQVVDANSGNFLRATADGTLELGPSEATRYQQWQLTNNDDGTMTVQNLGTGQSLQGTGTQDSLGAPATAPSLAGQAWRLGGPSSNQFALMLVKDGTCMVPAGTSAVTQGPCVTSGGWTLQTTVVVPAVPVAPMSPNTTTASPNTMVSPNTTTSPSLVMPWDTGGPLISDIRQGTANDCWVLAALSTVVYADPGFIKNHIAVNTDGTYTVTIYDGTGKPWTHTTGVIAPNIAYTPNASLTLANQRTGSLGQAIFWPSLYEQAFLAYAQANPGVFNTVDDKYLDTGSEVTAYQYITGDNWYFIDYQAPSDPSNDTFWTNLSYANNAIPVSALTNSPGSSTDMFPDGVLGDHFYAVLKTAGTGNNRTVTVRNPWGVRAPNVSDASNLGDGEMTMSYSNFVQYFFEIQRAQSTSGPP